MVSIRLKVFSYGVLLATLLTGCDTTDPGDFAPEYVVESYLVANEPLQPVLLSRTRALDTPYDFTEAAVQGADVRLHRLDDDGTIDATYDFREDPFFAGSYLPVDGRARAEPRQTYRLDVSIPGGAAPIQATTVVPDTFSVVRVTGDEVVYQGEEQLELTVTRSRAAGRDQNYYLFVTQAFDVREEQLTPFAKAFFDQQDGDVTLEELSVGGSPILNEENYDLNPDGTLTIRLPWLAITFYGRNRFYINAIDDNLYDFIRSQSIQQGGSTFSPGEIPNPLERITGAHGVFGSYARVSLDLFVKRAEDAN